MKESVGINKKLFEQPHSTSTNLYDIHKRDINHNIDPIELDFDVNASDEEEKEHSHSLNLDSV